MGAKKEFAELRRIAKDQKWKVEETRGGHLCWKSPMRGVKPIFSASTPGDKRAKQNLEADLRRAGLRIP